MTTFWAIRFPYGWTGPLWFSQIISSAQSGAP
jgi:hypothetical protein